MRWLSMPQSVTYPPDTSLTLEDLILRVAERAGCASYDSTTGKATVPTSAHDYDKCLRAVNDGIEMIYRANPSWSFLDQQLSFVMDTAGTGPLNIDSDPARYRMPWYITTPPKESWGIARGSGNTMYRFQIVNRQKVTWARGTGGVTGTGGDSIGPPLMAAVDQHAGADRRAWEMIFYPDPDSAYTIEATFRVFAPKMVTKTDRHVMGAAHDQTVVDAAFWAMKRVDCKEQGLLRQYEAMFKESLAQSIRLDQQFNPRNLGQVTDPSVCAGIGYDIGPRNITVIADGVP